MASRSASNPRPKAEIALAPLVLALASLLPAAVSREIDATALEALGNEQAPGVSVAVVRAGHIVFARGYGERDTRLRRHADPATRYAIGSVTKTIVAVLILQLAERGALSLDEHVTRRLPYFRNAAGMRVRDLLDQRSGLPDYNTARFLAENARAVVPGRVDRAALLHALAAEPLHFAPGSRYEYSNANYLLLGAIAETATGKPLPALLRTFIFEPAGMRDTALGGPGRSSDALGYTKSPFGPVSIGAWDPQLTYAAGGIRSTVLDLARFDIALVAGRLVAPATLSAMLTPAAGAAPDGYGFGLFAFEAGGRRVGWHDGTVLGFKAMNLIVPAGDDGVIVLANADYFHAQAVALRVAQLALQLPSGRDVPFDPNLPLWSAAFGVALALGAGAAILAAHGSRVVAVVLAILTYAGASVWLPAGLTLLVASLVVAAILAVRRRQPSESTNAATSSRTRSG